MVLIADHAGLILLFDPEIKITALPSLIIGRSDLTSWIKSTDQFINIMFKFFIKKKYINLIQMDCTSFHNRLLSMHHAPDIPLSHPAVHPEDDEGF